MKEVSLSKVITKNVLFSNRRKDYELGDTINVGLDTGETAVYTLTEIK
jgi:hypothetical protein